MYQLAIAKIKEVELVNDREIIQESKNLNDVDGTFNES